MLKDFNVCFKKGNIYGIIGANGIGKSTLVSLILGLYSNEIQGQITYNGHNINDINMLDARKNLIAFAEQEPFLINDTILYNLTYTNDIEYAGNKKNFDNCVKILNFEQFLAHHSLKFIIDENNSNISGGEKQKISLLKVLYRDTTLMIFDEPTSALDSTTTIQLIQYLQQIKPNKIIIIITHEDYVIKECDSIIQM